MNSKTEPKVNKTRIERLQEVSDGAGRECVMSWFTHQEATVGILHDESADVSDIPQQLYSATSGACVSRIAPSKTWQLRGFTAAGIWFREDID